MNEQRDLVIRVRQRFLENDRIVALLGRVARVIARDAATCDTLRAAVVDTSLEKIINNPKLPQLTADQVEHRAALAVTIALGLRHRSPGDFNNRNSQGVDVSDLPAVSVGESLNASAAARSLVSDGSALAFVQSAVAADLAKYGPPDVTAEQALQLAPIAVEQALDPVLQAEVAAERVAAAKAAALQQAQLDALAKLSQAAGALSGLGGLNLSF